MAKKYFTLEEANRLIPFLRGEVEQLQALKREFEVQFSELRRLKMLHGAGNVTMEREDPFFEMEARLEFLQIQARGIIRRIHEAEVQLKDIDMGLVDFPAKLNGQEVFFCWRLGEDRIRHWHYVWEGYYYRKSLDDELPGEDDELPGE
ncbi:MAG: DUF2203 domain-containing protein [Planifilum fimeticola]